MILVKNLPENIVKSIELYINKGEKFDVFPSKFFIDNTFYYLFTISPAREGLIVKDDGSVPPYNEIKKVGLISMAYNTSIETIMGIGLRWVKSSTRKNYSVLLDLLTKVNHLLANNIPSSVQQSLEAFINTPITILENQDIIETSVKNAVDLVDETNTKEITTIDDQKQLREYVIEMTRAGYRQNMIQLDSEADREVVIKYLLSNKFRNPKLLFYYFRVKKINQRMLNTSSKELEDILDAGKDLEEYITESLEETESRKGLLQTYRNPR